MWGTGTAICFKVSMNHTEKIIFDQLTKLYDMSKSFQWLISLTYMTFSEIYNYSLPCGSLGPTGHNPYGSQSTGDGSHHWCFYSLEILQCVPRAKPIIPNSSLGTPCEISHTRMPQELTNEKTALVQVMAWCHQASSHHLNQCWPRSMSPYSVTRPQCVNKRVWILPSRDNRVDWERVCL